MPIGQRVLSLIRIVLLGRSTHAGDVRPNELIIRPTHQHQEALPQYVCPKKENYTYQELFKPLPNTLLHPFLSNTGT
jgi:hypothetical protein